jgi:hypothetical protein
MNLDYQLAQAKQFHDPLAEEMKLRNAVGGGEVLAAIRKQMKEKREKELREQPRNYFLNEAHTTHITKAQARKERAAAKKKRTKK